MKVCKQCNSEYEDFGQRRPICRPCKQKYDREYHSKRSKDKKARKLELQVKRIKENVEWMRKLKQSKGCTDCGLKDWRVLDFDHLPGNNKTDSVAQMAISGFSKDQLKKEINKCEVVCANCHRIRTYERQTLSP